ncbi:MAG: type II secretion system protein [Burkholderiaceae bacterium]
MPYPDRQCGDVTGMHTSAVRRYQIGAGSEQGFTLIEAVMVIVITGIIAAVVAVFIRLPVQGYVNSVARAELTDVADTSLRRMARDMRLALPNSIRISGGNYLELLLTKTGGRYLAEEDNQGTAGILNFTNTAATSFTLVGTPPASPQAIVAGDSIVVYNLGLGVADAYSGGNRATVTGVAGNAITMATNPFAAQNPPFKSPTYRFQVVSSPVTYFCDGLSAGGTGRLTRYWNYAIAAAQPNTPALLAGAQSAILASNVQSCTFSYASLPNTHSALIGLTMTLSNAISGAGTVVLFHQVHVDNTP